MLTPLDIEQKEFKGSLVGYNKRDVDSFLDKIILDYEKLYKENITLKEKIDGMDDLLNNFKSMENSLKSTLILAEKTAEEIKLSAHKEAEMITREAENKITDLRAKYQSSKIQIKQMLKAQLELLDNINVDLINDDEDK